MSTQKENFQVAVKALLFSRGEYLLLQKSSKEEIAPLEWDTPGGRIKYRENLLDALKREVQEETGIKIDPQKAFPINVWSIERPNFQLIGINFLCILKNSKKPKLSFEHLSAAWLKAPQIFKNKSIPQWLKNSVTASFRIIDNK